MSGDRQVLALDLIIGSRLIKGYQTLLLNKALNEHQLPYAQEIFAFDVFIQNGDRTKDKPNVLTDGNEMVMLDHEIPFGFIITPFISPLIWEMPEKHKNWITHHCLLPLIVGQEFDFDRFMAKLDTLTETFWRKALELIPKSWRTEQSTTIKNILTRIVVNKKNFILELKKIMA